VPAIYRVIMESSHPLLALRPIDKWNQEFVYVTNLDLQIALLLAHTVVSPSDCTGDDATTTPPSNPSVMIDLDEALNASASS
jgi:hypothetical protein